MTFEEFKDAAKTTGYHFNIFFQTSFLKAISANTPINSPVFVAESISKNTHVCLYFPNNHGGATLVKGFGENRSIQFFDRINEIHA